MNSSRISRLAREKESDDLKEPIALVMENVSRKVTDHAMGNVDQKQIVRVMVSASRTVNVLVTVNAAQKEQTAHVTENADRKATVHEKEIVLGRWKVAGRPSSACWIRTRTVGCRKTNSPKQPNYSMSSIAITTASSTPPSCLADLVDQADQKDDLLAKEPHPHAANGVTHHAETPLDAMHPAVKLREATPHAVMHHGVKRHLKEIALPVNDGLTPTVRGEIASQGQKLIANEEQLQSFNALIATVTERSPRTKLRKR